MSDEPRPDEAALARVTAARTQPLLERLDAVRRAWADAGEGGRYEVSQDCPPLAEALDALVEPHVEAPAGQALDARPTPVTDSHEPGGTWPHEGQPVLVHDERGVTCAVCGYVYEEASPPGGEG
jgi:hypothetical protein